MAEVLATESGRAGHRPLNDSCRHLAGPQLEEGLLRHRRHIETEHDIAGRDSRLADEGRLGPGPRFNGFRFELVQDTRAGGTLQPPPGPAVCELFSGS